MVVGAPSSLASTSGIECVDGVESSGARLVDLPSYLIEQVVSRLRKLIVCIWSLEPGFIGLELGREDGRRRKSIRSSDSTSDVYVSPLSHSHITISRLGAQCCLPCARYCTLKYYYNTNTTAPITRIHNNTKT
jgi:hypothetical protein